MVLVRISVFLFVVRIILIFLIARKVRSLDSDEINNMMKKIVHKLKRYVDDNSIIESDESNEERKKRLVVDTIEFLDKSEESNSNSNEQEKEEEDSDKKAILSHFIDAIHQKVSQNSDED